MKKDNSLSNMTIKVINDYLEKADKVELIVTKKKEIAKSIGISPITLTKFINTYIKEHNINNNSFGI